MEIWRSTVITAVSAALVLTVGLTPAQAKDSDTNTSETKSSEVLERPDTVSAQVSARSIGKPVEDLSQRTPTEQVFANPDGSWTSETSTLPRFIEEKGKLVPIKESVALDEAGHAFSGTGAKVAVADGQEKPGDGPTDSSVNLVTMTGTGDATEAKMELGWEGALPSPKIADNVATFDSDITVPVVPIQEDDADSDDPVEATGEVAAQVTVEPTRTGFAHTTVISEVPEGDVEIRYPLGLSKGLSARQDDETGDLFVENKEGDLVFFASAPTMWDAAINEASGLPAAETLVDAELIKEDGEHVLVLKASHDWLASDEREYPVTIDPTWSAGAADTWIQSDTTSSKATSAELRVGTFDGGKTKARSLLRFGTTALSGKKITKAEIRLNNYYSYSCTASGTKVQRVTSAWTSADARWSNQPSATSSGEAKITKSLGYSSSCPGGYVYLPVTDITQYWANNPDKNFGVRLIAENESNNTSWKRYRSANHVNGELVKSEPHLLVTYNSYPNTPSPVTFGSGQSAKDASGKVWVRSLKPQFRSTVSDPDGGKVKAEFDMTGGSTLSKAAGTNVDSKSVSTYAATLAEGKTYTVSVWAHDGALRSKKASSAVTFTVDTKAPALPTVTSSSGYTHGSWKDTKPSSNTFTFASDSDTHVFEYQQNNDAWKTVNASSGKASITWNPAGSNTLKVRAKDKATNTSTVRTVTFGNGSASLSAPTAGMTTSDAFRVVAAGPTSSTGVVTPRVYWREANSVSGDTAQYGSTSGWYQAAELPAIAQGQNVAVDTMVDISNAPSGKLAELGKERVPALVELQVCFTYAGAASDKALQCTTNVSKPATAVTKLPHAFGANFPTATAGEGQVALTTGELNIAATDVSVDAGNTGLSVSRTYTSYSGIGANSKIFGPGWRANIDGPDEGLAGLLVVESTAVDGTVTLIDDDESAAVYRQPGGGKTSLKQGEYTPADENAIAAGWKVELKGSGASAVIKVTEEDGTVTTFTKGNALESGAAVFEWTPATVEGTSATGTTRFVRDNQGRTTKVISGTETSLNCDPTPVKGCRVLNLAYTGDVISKVTYTAWDPLTSKMATVDIAEYGYTSNKLTSVKDSRTGDITTYTYGPNSAAGVPLLASSEEKTHDGQRVAAPTYYEYGTGAGNGRSDWLESVKRGNATDGSGKIQLARFVYGVPADGNGTTLPALSEQAVGLWEQDAAPVTGYAVFGPGKDMTTSKAGNVAAGDWRYADLTYVDDRNRIVNTASFAAGAWQVSAQVFNGDNMVVRSYDQRGLRLLRAQAEEDSDRVVDGVFTGHTDYATVTAYHSDEDFLTEEGTPRGDTPEDQSTNKAKAEHVRGYATDVWSPVILTEDGQPARSHSHTVYTPVTEVDAGGMPRMLVTETTVTAAPSGELKPGSDGEPVISKTRNSYDAFEKDGEGRATTDKENTRSGWVHGSPTTVTTVMESGGNIEARTWMDDSGRTVKTLQPLSSGSDAGATRTVYYSAAANSDYPECGNVPEYAGYVCRTVPLGAGSVSKHQTGFNIYGQPAEFTEASTTPGENAKRTTQQTYRADGQELVTTVTSSGVQGSTALPAVERLYDARGVNVGQRTLGGNPSEIRWETNLWGQQTSYTNSAGETSTTEYDAFGNVAKTITPQGTSQFWYGALSGHSDAEYQGVLTKMTITGHGGVNDVGTYTASYDGDGNMLTQTMPGGLSQVRQYDDSGSEVGLAYHGPVTDENGEEGTGVWLAWSRAVDASGRVVGENTPDGVWRAGLAGDGAGDYDRSYSYDGAGRLVKVKDITAAPGDLVNTDPDEGVVTPVVERVYAFDKNGNRTGLATRVDGEQVSVREWAYDAADRFATGGYVFDGLGRQLTVPAVDAPVTGGFAAGSGDITVSYFDDDQARTISRGSVTTTIDLDSAGRRLTLTGSGDGAVVKNHYVDSSDNPGWSTSTVGGDTTLTRYESTIGGDLALTITDGVVSVALSNPNGDVVATLPLNGDDAGAGIASWAAFDEYGNLTSTTPANTGVNTYGWHGKSQRALDASGLILMGVRLYNSATGAFTSRDPIDGGNTTTYAYPQDPINQHDLDGQAKNWRDSWLWRNKWTVASVAVGFIPGVGAAAWAYRGYRVARAVNYATKANRLKKFGTTFKKATKAVATRVKNNNFVRVGRVKKDGHFRVSFGPAPKHWAKLSPRRQKIQRHHLHIDRTVVAFTRYRKGTTHRHFWGK